MTPIFGKTRDGFKMAEIFITRKVFRHVIDMLEKEGHAIDINDTDRILPARELVERAHGKAGIVSVSYTHLTLPTN